MNVKLEPHFQAIYESNNAALTVVEELPETDAVLELIGILEIQNDIIMTLIEQKHYGSNPLDNFIHYCKKITHELQENKRD